MIPDAYTAVSIAEGFAGTESSIEEQLEAWAYLIRTGRAWNLQGWFGRRAADLIENGLISQAGDIQWDVAGGLVDEV